MLWALIVKVRVGKLLDELGRPADKVQIIRLGKDNTRIKQSTNYWGSWAADIEQVSTDPRLSGRRPALRFTPAGQFRL